MQTQCQGFSAVSNCTVIANFAIDSPSTYLVTPSVVGNGNIIPSTAVTVNSGSTTQFTVYPYSPYYIESITGTCGGTLSGSTFMTNAITSNCTVIANFAACGYSITPSNQSFTSSGGSGSVGVTAPSGCGWGAYSNVYWITVTAVNGGNGNGTVNYSVAANTSVASRTGTLNIGGQIFTVTQTGYQETINPPTNLQAVANADNTITLTWNDNSVNEDAFLLDYKFGVNSEYTRRVNLSSNVTSWLDNGYGSGLYPGTTYCYRIRVFSSAFGYSAYSNETCATLYSGVLSVTPTGDFSFSGNEGGQFTPTTNTLTIQNSGNSPFDWTASSNASWTSLNPTAGNLVAGGTATVTISINSNANTLTSGIYNDAITISANGAVNSPQTRSVSLSISPSGTGWNIETIDSTGYVGRSSHLAIDSNNKIHISYADEGPNGFYTHLKYATNTSGSWFTTTLASEDGSGYYIGYFNDIAIDNNDKIHISFKYYNNPSNTAYLKYVTNASGTWVTSIIDNSGSAGSFNSIAIDSNNKAHISYIGSSNLEYTTNVSGSWVISTIDNSGHARGNSIAIDLNDKVHVIYFDDDPINRALKYATNLSGSWVIYTIESNLAYDISNKYPSLVVDNNNNVHISYPYAYYNQGWTQEIKYATNASGSWLTSIIDNNQSSNDYFYSSIAVDSSNKVHISYSDFSNLDLKYATNTSGSWVTSIVDNLAYGEYSSIALDSDNKAHISYNDTSNWDLKYAKQMDDIPPTGQISINNGSAYTTTTSVNLTLSAFDPSWVSPMCISNTATCSTWEAFTTSKSWTLSSGDGTKSVYVWFKDSAGNVNSTPYSDSIIFDATAPANGTLAATAGDKEVLLSWSGFNDALSGINNYKVVYSTGDTPSSCSTGTQIYYGSGTSYPHSALTNGVTYNYRICAVDSAGNISTGATASATPVTLIPNITVAPSSLNFGNVTVNTTSTSQTVTVTNVGTANLSISAVTLTGANSSEYIKQVDTCSGNTLPPSGNCNVQIAFMPASAGAKTAGLAITSNDPDTPILNIPLSGTGVQPVWQGPLDLVLTCPTNVTAGNALSVTVKLYNYDCTNSISVNRLITQLMGNSSGTLMGLGIWGPYNKSIATKTVSAATCDEFGNVTPGGPVSFSLTIMSQTPASLAGKMAEVTVDAITSKGESIGSGSCMVNVQ